MKMTLQQANHLIETVDKMFGRAALAWERGHNSGNSVGMARGEKQCEACRTRAEKMLEPLGISVDYPGLYPSFTVAGGSYHTTESAVSAALELNSVSITLANDEDKRNFLVCREKAIATGGTMAPLWCGILSALLKRSTIN